MKKNQAPQISILHLAMKSFLFFSLYWVTAVGDFEFMSSSTVLPLKKTTNYDSEENQKDFGTKNIGFG